MHTPLRGEGDLQLLHAKTEGLRNGEQGQRRGGKQPRVGKCEKWGAAGFSGLPKPSLAKPSLVFGLPTEHAAAEVNFQRQPKYAERWEAGAECLELGVGSFGPRVARSMRVVGRRRVNRPWSRN